MGHLLRGRRKPSAAMLVAIVALVVAASGTAVAASKLVSGDSLIKKNSLSGNRLRNGSIAGSKLKLNSLGTVPSARHATSADSAINATNATNAANATNATNATNAGSATTAGSAPIAKLTYVTATVSVPGDGSLTTGTAICPAGTDATGGGGRIDDPSGGALLGSYPAGKTGWSADFTDFSQTATGTVYAVCAPAASTAP